MLTRIRRWWNGEVREIDDGEPDTIGGIGMLRETEVVHHWTALWARKAVRLPKATHEKKTNQTQHLK